MRQAWIVVVCIVASSVALSGCAGSGTGLDSNGRPIGSEGGGGTLTPDFGSIQANVFTPICSVCHAGGAAPQGLRLDAVNSYSMIVGVPSTEDPAVLRIKPGDPDNSYLIQKIEGHAAVGAQMPFGGPPLPAATIAVMRQWVSDGALPATASAAPAVLRVVTAVPAANEVVLSAPRTLIVTFSAELDRAALDTTALKLVRIDASRAGAAVPIPVRVEVPAGNPAALLVTPAVPLVDGRYRWSVTAGAGSGIADIQGRRLGADAEVEVATFDVEAGS